jgi:hypothetical protein
MNIKIFILLGPYNGYLAQNWKFEEMRKLKARPITR